MVYGYARVSTQGQVEGNSLEDQRKTILQEYPEAEIIEEQYSGIADARPKYDALMNQLQDGDKLVVTKLDRLCRTTQKGLQDIQYLRSKNVRVHILNVGLIEDTPTGNLILTIMLAFAEFERTQILERTQAGKEIARKRPGYREGRPFKHTRKQRKHALELLKTHSYRQVEEMTGISVSTLQRIKKAAAETSDGV